MEQFRTTFKIYIRYKSDSSRERMRLGHNSIERFIIVRRDEDGGYADKDATCKHLTDSLKFFFAGHHPR
jgi:hypothetical protein